MAKRTGHPKFIRDKITESLQPFVFENICPDTHQAITIAVMDVLIEYYKQEILVGSKRSEAFFVKCDSINNTERDIAEGRINIDVGVALNEPNEFSIVRYEQTRLESPRVFIQEVK